MDQARFVKKKKYARWKKSVDMDKYILHKETNEDWAEDVVYKEMGKNVVWKEIWNKMRDGEKEGDEGKRKFM